MARQLISFGSGPGTQTGDTAYVGGQKINSNFEELYTMVDVLTRLDIIDTANGFSISGTNVTVNADWIWIINNSQYTNPDAVVLAVDLSSTGMIRKVYVVPNSSNGFNLVEGEEVDDSVTDPPTPELPYGGMYVTYFNVTDTVIGSPAATNNGDSLSNKLDKGSFYGTADDLVDKNSYSWTNVNALSGVVVDYVNPFTGMSINFKDAVTELHSLSFPTVAKRPYFGALGFIKNSQTIDILIPHKKLSLVANRYCFAFPNEQDLVLKPNEILFFKADPDETHSYGYLDAIGVGFNDNDLVHKTGDEEVDGNKSFLQPVSGVEATADEHLVTKAQLDLKLDAADYNNHYKGKYTSLGALETAHPTANAGDYAQVDAGSGSDVVNYNWDDEEGWVVGSSGSGATDTDALPEGSTNLYFTPARVLATVLTGISFVTGGAIVSTDSVLVAFGKLQKQLNDGFTAANIRSLLGITVLSGSNTGDQDLSGLMTTGTDQTVSGIKTFLAGKFGLRNVANTFTSFFTNTNTASRTYTLPDKNGTVAMTSDLPTNTVATGTQNKLLKYTNSGGTQAGNSRIKDDGTYLGIDTQWSLSADFLFGYLLASRTIGIEDSVSNVSGRDLIIKSGRAINFDPSGGEFNGIGETFRTWRSIAINSTTGDVYAGISGGDIYKQTAGTGSFSGIGSSSLVCFGIAVNSINNDVYATNYAGDIYKQTAGTGSFVALSAGIRNWRSIAINSTTGDVYAVVSSGDIYKQTAGTGSFVALSAGNKLWTGIGINSTTGDVYACVENGDIYKQTAGTGSFVAQGQASRAWYAITIDSTNNNVYVANYAGDIYKQTAGTGSFVAQGYVSRAWTGIAINSTTKDIYGCVNNNDIYVRINNALGTANLNGGALKLKAGTGKGTGESRIPFYTGQKTTSGTDMQVETLRGYFDENGFFVHLSTPEYANDAAADADTNLPSGAHYKITGSRQLYQKP